MWEQASFSDKISFVFGGFFIVAMILLGVGYLTGNVDGPAPAPVEEVVDYDQMYQNCMKSIEGYIDDGGSRWDDAAENCAMIGSFQG
jgi:hypothetical protein